MKRIFFTQQKPFEYMPLRAGLGLITEQEFQDWQDKRNENAFTCVGYLCPKIYTTRTRQMSGEYYVVEGSRFKAKPVVPEIKFAVNVSPMLLRLDEQKAYFLNEGKPTKESKDVIYLGDTNHEIDETDLSFPELDLGIRGATFNMLKDLLLKLNKNTTIETFFYVNLLESIDDER